MKRLMNWLGHPVTIVVLAIVALVGLIAMQSVAMDGECANMMRLAHSSRDSLDAKIACNKMHSDAATANAVAIGAGLVAGSAASRR